MTVIDVWKTHPKFIRNCQLKVHAHTVVAMEIRLEYDFLDPKLCTVCWQCSLVEESLVERLSCKNIL